MYSCDVNKCGGVCWCEGDNGANGMQGYGCLDDLSFGKDLFGCRGVRIGEGERRCDPLDRLGKSGDRHRFGIIHHESRFVPVSHDHN